MKERIVIGRNTETSEYYKKFPNRSGKAIDHIQILAPIEQNVRFEQVPETWEELKELCKNLKEEDILVTRDVIGFRDLHFYKSGLVCIPDSEYFSISTGRTPQQMWQIIKNLIG